MANKSFKRNADSRFTRSVRCEMKDICSKICTCNIFRQVAGENCFSPTFNSRAEKIVDFHPERGGSVPRLREKLARCFNERGNFGATRSGLVYSTAWFIRTGRSLRVIYIYRQNSRRQFGICIQPWLFVSRPGSILFNVRPSVRPSVAYVARRIYATFCVMRLIMQIRPSPTCPPTCSFAVTLIHRFR